MKTFELKFFIHNEQKEYPIISSTSIHSNKLCAMEYAVYLGSKLALEYQSVVTLLSIKGVK